MFDVISDKLHVVESSIKTEISKLDDEYIRGYKNIVRKIEFYYNEVNKEHS